MMFRLASSMRPPVLIDNEQSITIVICPATDPLVSFLTNNSAPRALSLSWVTSRNLDFCSTGALEIPNTVWCPRKYTFNEVPGIVSWSSHSFERSNFPFRTLLNTRCLGASANLISFPAFLSSFINGVRFVLVAF